MSFLTKSCIFQESYKKTTLYSFMKETTEKCVQLYIHACVYCFSSHTGRDFPFTSSTHSQSHCRKMTHFLGSTAVWYISVGNPKLMNLILPRSTRKRLWFNTGFHFRACHTIKGLPRFQRVETEIKQLSG